MNLRMRYSHKCRNAASGALKIILGPDQRMTSWMRLRMSGL